MRLLNLFLIITFFIGGISKITETLLKRNLPIFNSYQIELKDDEFLKKTTLANINTKQKQDNSWELFKDEDGIQVYSRVLPGSTWHQRKATTLIDNNPSAVVALIKDHEVGPQWIDRMLEFKTIKIVSQREWYSYSVLEIPWPFSNRDLITRNVVTQDSVTKAITISLISYPDFIAEKSNRVRMGKSEGAWIIEPLGRNKSKLTYLMWSEPGKFVIPQSIITPIVVKSIHTTMVNMKKMLTKDKYKN